MIKITIYLYMILIGR